MSPKGRPEGEYRSAQREGTPVSAPGRPKREYRSAQREGTPVSGGQDETCYNRASSDCRPWIMSRAFAPISPTARN